MEYRGRGKPMLRTLILIGLASAVFGCYGAMDHRSYFLTETSQAEVVALDSDVTEA